MSRAAFLDRDGVINRKPPEGEYVTRWEELHLLPDVASAILSLNQAGFRAIVVTNQRCIAKGFVSAADVETMHQRMCAELAAKGAKIEKIYYCPHETSRLCSCRKPSPGMLLQAARENGIDMKHSWMIGDSEIDVKAGKSAGCMTARILSTNESNNSCPDIVGSSLIEVVNKMLSYAPSVGIPTTSK